MLEPQVTIIHSSGQATANVCVSTTRECVPSLKQLHRPLSVPPSIMAATWLSLAPTTLTEVIAHQSTCQSQPAGLFMTQRMSYQHYQLINAGLEKKKFHCSSTRYRRIDFMTSGL